MADCSLLCSFVVPPIAVGGIACVGAYGCQSAAALLSTNPAYTAETACALLQGVPCVCQTAAAGICTAVDTPPSPACALNFCYKARYYRQYAGNRQKLRGNQRADAAYAENYAERRVSARELAEEAPSPSRSSKL